jgi:Tol biopolymer transport system component
LRPYIILITLFAILLCAKIGFAYTEQRLTTDTAEDDSPCWSPDGTKIAFHSFRNGHSDIWEMNADGSNQHLIYEHPNGAYAPAWSPDGTRSAYTSCTPPGGIWIMPSEGGPGTRITFGTYDVDPCWSPDSTYIAYSAAFDTVYGYGIFKVPATGGTPVRLTPDDYVEYNNPSWSPDGTKIAFDGDISFNREVLIIPSDGGDITRITQNLVDSYEPTWSPDSTQIGLSCHQSGYQEIWTIPSMGGVAIQLTYDEWMNEEPAWSPDGTKIAFTNWCNNPEPFGNYDIYVIDLISTKVVNKSLGQVKALYK